MAVQMGVTVHGSELTGTSRLKTGPLRGEKQMSAATMRRHLRI